MTEKKFSKDHEWIELNDNMATIGITNHAQESLGDIVFIDLPEVGKNVQAGNEICVIESVKAASDIYSPLDGEIFEVNTTLSEDASIINKDAENEGWIFKVKISNPNQFKDLMSSEEYKFFLENE